VRRAVDILKYLASDVEPRSFTEIRTALRLEKSSANRFLATHEEAGMVQRSPETGRYRLGLAALRIGTVAGNQIELRRITRPFLVELTQRTGETSNLGVLGDTRPVFLDNVESPQSLRMFSRIGRRASPYCTSLGKTLLAYLPPDQLRAILDQEPFETHTHKSISTPAKLQSELERIRNVGYAVDDEESERGARCIGGPLRDHSGRVVAAISISGPSSRISPADVPRLGAIVRDVAERASLSMGYTTTIRAKERGAGAAPMGRDAVQMRLVRRRYVGIL